jgi:hypothetical protein
MTNIILRNDYEFTPSIAVTGTIVMRTRRTYMPQLGGDVIFSGSILPKIPRPQPLTPLAGQFTIQGRIAAGIRVPAAAFKDFSHYPYGGVDPAMAWTGITSGTLKSAVAGSYSRPYAAFTGPVDYPVSGSGYAWKRAAYASVGFKFVSMSANKHQILDAVQFEPLPLGATGPSPYQNAREIHAVIKPTRLNYASNPNFESGITGYSVVQQSTLVADAFCWKGTASLKTTVSATATADSGFSFQVTGLIPGRRYTLSARVAIATGCGNLYAWCSTGAVRITRNDFRTAKTDANRRWRVLTMTFDATQSTVSLGIDVSKSTMAAGVASIFWTDGVLVEEGTAVRDYFDGSMGADYLWETGGSANLTRSYFYENRVERSYLIRTLLDENTPLGISSAVPQYAVLPTQ